MHTGISVDLLEVICRERGKIPNRGCKAFVESHESGPDSKNPEGALWHHNCGTINSIFYEFEYYIKHEVNDKAKYLNLLVLLTFLVGHVQYAYASYFCTMKQAPVQSPAMNMTPPSNQTEDACTQCSDVIPPREGPQFVEGNCIKIVTAEKSVVSSFTDSVKLLNHFVTAYSFVPVLNYQPSAINYQLFTHSNSPPLDLPILISNLRI